MDEITCAAIGNARNRLIESGLAGQDSFLGCTAGEIESIEKRFSIHLPKCYREFLSIMGRAAGKFLMGTDYSYSKTMGFRSDAETLLQNAKSPFSLPLTAFVFVFHQGYTFLFFDCQDDQEDPPVFMFTEGEIVPCMISDSFSAWLQMATADDIDASRELAD